jgi:hypothetical protein
MLDGDGSEDGDDDEAVVVSSRPNAPKAKRSRSQTKGKEEKEKKKKKKRPRTTRTQRTAQPVDDEEGDQDTGGQPAIDAIDAGTMTVDASAIPPALQWEVGASGIASTQLRSFDEEVASSTGTDQVCSLPVSCLCLRLLLCVWVCLVAQNRSIIEKFGPALPGLLKIFPKKAVGSPMLDKERSNPSEFNAKRAKAFTLAQSVLAFVRNRYGGDDVDVGKTSSSSFTSELVTHEPCLWSGHGRKNDGTFALPLEGDDTKGLEELRAMAKGAHTLDKTLAHIRLVLYLLRKE